MEFHLQKHCLSCILFSVLLNILAGKQMLLKIPKISHDKIQV